MRRAAGTLLLVLGWALILVGTILFGFLVPVPVYWDEVATDSVFIVLVVAIVAVLAGIGTVRWAWSLLGTPGGSYRRRKAFAWVLLVISGLGLVGALDPSDNQFEWEQATRIAAAAAPSVLAVILLLIPFRRAQAERSVAVPAIPSSPVAQGMELAPARESFAPLPDAPAPEPEPVTRRKGLWTIAGLTAAIVILVIAIVALVVVPSEDGLPDQVAGLDRLHTDDAEAFEDTVGENRFGDVRVDGAVYGTEAVEQLILARYSNVAPAVSISSLLRGAGGGLVIGGGTVDFDAEAIQTRAGVEYHCIPFEGRLFPSDVFPARGQLCVWAEGDDEAALLIDVVAQDAGSAVTHAAAAHEALS